MECIMSLYVQYDVVILDFKSIYLALFRKKVIQPSQLLSKQQTIFLDFVRKGVAAILSEAPNTKFSIIIADTDQLGIKINSRFYITQSQFKSCMSCPNANLLLLPAKDESQQVASVPHFINTIRTKWNASLNKITISALGLEVFSSVKAAYENVGISMPRLQQAKVESTLFEEVMLDMNEEGYECNPDKVLPRPFTHQRLVQNGVFKIKSKALEQSSQKQPEKPSGFVL